MGTESHIRRERRLREQGIARLAASQHGVVSIDQLLDTGLGGDAVRKRIGDGRLHPVHRGVYAVGHPAISREGIWSAAVLAGPAGTHLSHRSAANLWELLPEEGRRVEITSPTHLPHRPALRVHYCRLMPTEVTERSGIPVTAVPRTLIDLAAVAPHRLVSAVHRAEVLGLVVEDELAKAILLNRGRRGVARLRAVAELRAAPVRSELERRFLALIRRAGLPQPETGLLLEAGDELVECDFLWREQRLIAELDGRRYHETTIAFERDRARDRRLQASGWQIVRVTWNQVRYPEPLLTDLRRLLQRRMQG